MKNNKPIIGLDIDGVICNFVEGFYKHFNRDINLRSRNYNDPFIVDNFDKIKHDDNFWSKLRPLINPNEMPFVPNYYITARPIYTFITEEWLVRNNFKYAPVITVGHNKSKVKACQDVGVTLFVDNYIKHYEELNEAKIKCYLYTDYCNEFESVMYRVNSLKEFAEKENLNKPNSIKLKFDKKPKVSMVDPIDLGKLNNFEIRLLDQNKFFYYLSEMDINYFVKLDNQFKEIGDNAVRHFSKDGTILGFRQQGVRINSRIRDYMRNHRF